MTEPKSYWENRVVIVTGAGGFIGSHLVEALVRQGARVKALVKYNGAGRWGNLDALPPEIQSQVEVVLGDVTDGHFIRKLLAGADVVFHLAALIGIPYSYVAPQHYLNVNIQGTLNVLEACLQNNVSRLVHTSTSEAYGTARYTPIDESHPLQGQSPYSATKIAADKLVESYTLSFGVPAVTVRPFNTYGPRQSARAFIPSMISQALVQPIIQVGDLTPARDLCFVADTVAGFLAAGSADRAIGELINLGTERSYSMEDVLERILALTGLPRPEIQTDSDRIRPAKSEVLLLECNAQKAHTLLNWTATVTLDQGLQRTIEDIRSHPERYRAANYAI